MAVAIFAAYTALNMISRLHQYSARKMRNSQAAVSGVIMGMGIWSMHFIGMLAYILPITVLYDALITAVSMIVAIIASIFGLLLAIDRESNIAIVIGGIIVGLGIASMHYIGMAAMVIPGMMHYDSLIVLLSVVIAIIAAIAALWLSIAIGRGEVASTFSIKLTSAVIMGFAIAGMHYTGMAAMSVYPMEPHIITPSGLDLDPTLIGIVITLAISLILSFSLWSSQMVSESNLVKSSEEKIRAITENVLDVIIMINTHGIIEFCNATITDIFGYRPEEVIGKNVNMLMPEPWRHRHDGYINRYLETRQPNILGKVLRELQAVHKDGSEFPIDLSVREATIEGKTVFIGAIRNIEDRVKAREHLDFLAHHDTLTELPNRFSFQKHIEQAFAHARRTNRNVALLFLDLDRFKVINDSLGHHVGDFLLKGVAERLQGAIREGDVIARISGDEFTVLLDDISTIDDIPPVADKILNIFSEPFRHSSDDLYTTASIGISIFPDDAFDPSSMMRHADIAMYRSKAEGGNRYHFYSSGMDEKANTRLNLETGLRHALERDEYFLVYQPQVGDDNRIIGAEALLRWQHPEQGLVKPDEFVPLLEETGLIIPVGEWVMRQACRQNKAWQEAGLSPIRIAVNLSTHQLTEKLADSIQGILEETGLAPEYLEIEITENALMKLTGTTLDIVQQLRNKGIQLSIDDFGTGYSSLSYLRRLPLHSLKIDRSFVRDITDDKDDAAIVKLIVDMARSLKLNVIAEGVENKDQLKLLKQYQCTGYQGFYYSKPLEIDEILPLLHDGHLQ